MIKQRMKVGGFVKIPLADGTHVYARIGNEWSFHIYDFRGNEEIKDMTQIGALPILFVTYTSKKVVTQGRWLIVGWLPLEDALQKNPLLYMPDITDPDYHRIYDNGDIRPATKEEVTDLEVLTAWHPEEIEERILDHYMGRENQILAALRESRFKTFKGLHK